MKWGDEKFNLAQAGYILLHKRINIMAEYAWGNEFKSWLEKHKQVYQTEFDLAYRVSEQFSLAFTSHEPSINSQRELVLCSFATRISGQFEGTILLAKHGMQAEAKIVCRTLLESTFKFVAMSKSPNLIRHYVSEFNLEKKKMLKKIREHSVLREKYGEEELNEEEKEIDKQISEDKPKKFPCSEWAKKAGLYQLYLTQYSLLSHAVHTKVHDLEKVVNIDSQGQIESIMYGPTDKGLKEVFVAATHCILAVYEAFCSSFSLENYYDKHKKLVEEFNSYLNDLEDN